jgi:hypothetical protein
MRGRANARQVQRMANVMNEKTTKLNQKPKHRMDLAYEVFDEALESAAMVNGITKNLTITFCSTPWTCPMSPAFIILHEICNTDPTR